MPRLPGDDEGVRVRLAISPVAELFNSLHVLAEPSHHHSNQAWAAATQARLAAQAPDLRDEIAAFGQQFDQWLQLADLLELADDVAMAVPDFLALLAASPAERILAVGLAGAYLDEAATHDPATLAAHRAARSDPAAFVARLLTTLRRYWEEVFAAEWRQRLPTLEQRRAREAARLEQMKPILWATELHERISYEAGGADNSNDGTLVFHKGHDYRFPLAEIAQLTCIPSTFSAPHLMIAFQQFQQAGGQRTSLTIFVNTPPPTVQAERVPAALLDVTKALADETRLRIYKATLRRPHYTQELAAALKLAEPTVSRHLKILREAGLVRARKESGVVLYTGVLDPVDALPAVMREFLRG